MPGISAGKARIIYHLLSWPLSQGVTVAQVVDLNVLDVVAICDIDLTVEFGDTDRFRIRWLSCGDRTRRLVMSACGRFEGNGSYRTDWTGGTSTFCMPLRASS